MNLTLTFDDSDVVLAIEVAAEMTVADLRAYALEEAGFSTKPPRGVLYNGRILQDSETLEATGLHDGDMVLISADAGGRRGSGDSYNSAASSGSAGKSQQTAAAGGDVDGSGLGPGGEALSAQIETARKQILYDPQLFAQLSQQSPDLSEALHDREAFQKVYRKLYSQQLRSKTEGEEIDRNLRLALEEMPEAFTTVTMLFADMKVNGVPVKAFIDSGAQTTIMSPECAERCHLTHLIDKRHRGMAYGVGQATIIGRIHMAPINIGSSYFPCAMTVLEGTNIDFLLGLDMLKHHQAIIDLQRNILRMGHEELPFLGESEIPKTLLPGAAPADSEFSKPMTLAGNAASMRARQNPPIPSDLNRAAAASSTEDRPSNSAAETAGGSSNSDGTDGNFDEAMVKNLVNLGFSRTQVVNALQKAGGNADVAAALLFGD